MSKKKITILCVSVMVALVSIVGITFAVWTEVNNITNEIENPSGDWNESAKYIEYEEIRSDEVTVGYKVVGYTGLIANVKIPRQHKGHDVIEIGRAFTHNTVVQEVIIPTGVTVIASNAFANATRLIKVTIMGDSVPQLVIGDYAFAGCGLLSTFTYNRNITSIGSNAFLGCSSLATLPTVA